ncbi:TetR/AcrR family transcriptional regulator [Nocardia aobensis]|uniref:TetR/AcrR family transcriptional regulator n=1 Tax=Nocardia aobensis TaxID=257277 RepID=UPI00031D15E2|nr:TetR/AcrR family transcriptional regulator [Nocardia aobensis]
MTVNQVGRPSKANERIREILEATFAVAVREGLAGVTFSKVADAAGLRRTLVLHYFGSRDELIGAFIDHVVGAMGSEIVHRHGDLPLRLRVAAAYAPGAYRSRDDMVVWAELVALSARDPAVRERLHDLWTQRWLPDLEAVLAERYPAVGAEDVSAAAYALVCLFEAHWALDIQGVVDERKQQQVERAAMVILDGLGTPDGSDSDPQGRWP